MHEELESVSKEDKERFRNLYTKILRAIEANKEREKTDRSSED